ncbi:MAG: hypothetical protein AAF788_06070 [Pseudomonadota bacterium]
MVLAAFAIAAIILQVLVGRLDLTNAARQRLIVIGVTTLVVMAFLLSLRLSPLALLALLFGALLAGNTVMREVARRGDFKDLGDRSPPPRSRAPQMERTEALAVLGLEGEPSKDAIHAAHKRMILRAHPDQGGSDYLAAKVNEARRILLAKN